MDGSLTPEALGFTEHAFAPAPQPDSNIVVLAGGKAAPPLRNITATPFKWIEPKSIPPREWIYDYHYIRQFVSTTVAPGGVGKTVFTIVEALAMATGRDLLGVK